MRRKQTVSVAIPAYNEGQNIKNLLLSILSQKFDGFIFEKIIVLSDGSTDNTIEAVKTMKNKKIQIIKNNKNKGRVYSRNRLMKEINSDILVFLDADGVLERNKSLNLLLRGISIENGVLLSCGNPIYREGKTFLSKSLQIADEAYTEIRYSINNGNNIFGSFGSMMALAKPLYKKLTIPNDIFSDDSYIYLQCKKIGYKSANVRRARAWHEFPKTLYSHIRRNTRFSTAKLELEKYFGGQVDKEFYIPKNLFLASSFEQFTKYPVNSVFIYLVNSYTRLLAYINQYYEKN